MFEKFKKYFKGGMIVLFFILALISFNLKKNKNIKESDIVVEKDIREEKVLKEEPLIETIKVDIKGEVENPSVVELAKGSRVIDAINSSGGLKESADTSLINLSKFLKDEMVIIVYSKEEVEKLNSNNKVIELQEECVCENIKNDALIEKIEEKDKDGSLSNGKISINNASLEELMNLTGIGEAKAKAIIEYREEHGGFKDISEIKNVSGIGDSAYEKIKDEITI